MRRAAKQKNAHLSISAEGYTMKERFVIRLTRKNEINAAWVFLILASLIFLVIALIARSLTESIIPILASVLILFIAIIYQGFEVVKK